MKISEQQRRCAELSLEGLALGDAFGHALSSCFLGNAVA